MQLLHNLLEGIIYAKRVVLLSVRVTQVCLSCLKAEDGIRDLHRQASGIMFCGHNFNIYTKGQRNFLYSVVEYRN